MKDIIVRVLDDTLEIRLRFIVKHALKYTHVGKCWPKQTQCLMYFNGSLKCFNTIVKHVNDEDNQVFAYKLVAERCLKDISNKWLRSQVRSELDKSIGFKTNSNKI